jgi:uncharacterized membrane protein
MKKAFLLLSLLGVWTTGTACTLCNKQIREGIYNSTFYPNLLTMLSAFIVLAIIVAVLSVVSARRHKARLSASPAVSILSPLPLTTAAMVLGIGLGGFIEGIVLHQLLQWHEMLSHKIPATNYVGKSINMFWDGVFHAFSFIVVLIGIFLLWRLSQHKEADKSGRLLAGGLLTGWGIFNIVEGIIDHHLLVLHNVMEFSPDHDPANYTFLGISVVVLLAGCLLVFRNSKIHAQSA